MNRKHWSGAIIGATLLASNASAATLTYEYRGMPLVLESETAKHTLSSPGFSGKVVLNEELLGSSVAGKDLMLECDFDSGVPAQPYVVALEFMGNCGTWAGLASFNISFDESRRLTDWKIDILDGPPDYISNPEEDILFDNNNTFFSVAPGEWHLSSIDGELVPIPTPATSASLGMALGLLLMVSSMLRRRERAESAQ